jgi:hypothetical protein
MYLWFVLPTTLYTAFFRALPQILFDIFCPALLIHDMRCPNLNCLISSYPIPSPIYFYSVLISSVITNSEILYLFQQWNDIKRQIFEWIRSNQFTTATGYSWFINSQTIHNCVHQCLKQNIHETFISFHLNWPFDLKLFIPVTCTYFSNIYWSLPLVHLPMKLLMLGQQLKNT